MFVKIKFVGILYDRLCSPIRGKSTLPLGGRDRRKDSKEELFTRMSIDLRKHKKDKLLKRALYFINKAAKH